MNAFKIVNQENKLTLKQSLVCTFSRSAISKFIQRNTEVFEGLARNSTPFGGSIRPTSRTTHINQSSRIHPVQNTTTNTMTPLEQRLVLLQQQLEQLHTEVASLLAQTSTTTQSANSLTRPQSTDSTVASQKSPVGIDRYRQLQAIE